MFIAYEAPEKAPSEIGGKHIAKQGMDDLYQYFSFGRKSEGFAVQYDQPEAHQTDERNGIYPVKNAGGSIPHLNLMKVVTHIARSLNMNLGDTLVLVQCDK